MLYYEYINDRKFSFSDRKVLLFDSFDGILHGYRYEKLKASFRIAYSIFDKISAFLNDYFSLGNRPNSRQVSFRSIWYNRDSQLESKFLNNNNWMFRALFSLSKDLFDKNFQSALPEGQLFRRSSKRDRA